MLEKDQHFRIDSTQVLQELLSMVICLTFGVFFLNSDLINIILKQFDSDYTTETVANRETIVKREEVIKYGEDNDSDTMRF